MNFVTRISVCFLFLLMAGVSVSYAQSGRAKPSQLASVEQTVGSAVMKITYHRPNMKGRVLWGDKDALVPNGKVWRAGANNATVFEVTEDISINGMPLPAGKYSFYAIPGEKEWTLIFNKDWDQWGTVYDQKSDALRVESKPSNSEESKESLGYAFEDIKANSARVNLAWGNLVVSFDVTTGN